MEVAQRTIPFSTYDLAAQYTDPIRLPTWKRAVLRGATKIGSLLQGQVVRILDEQSKRLSERAMAVRALAEEIRNAAAGDQELDHEDRLRAKLEHAEAEILLAVGRLDNLEATDGLEPMLSAAARCTASARAVHVALRELKGAIQAHDANISALKRAATKPATTAAELESQLDAAFGN